MLGGERSLLPEILGQADPVGRFSVDIRSYCLSSST